MLGLYKDRQDLFTISITELQNYAHYAKTHENIIYGQII
jgi:hypothetical protein